MQPQGTEMPGLACLPDATQRIGRGRSQSDLAIIKPAWRPTDQAGTTRIGNLQARAANRTFRAGKRRSATTDPAGQSTTTRPCVLTTRKESRPFIAPRGKSGRRRAARSRGPVRVAAVLRALHRRLPARAADGYTCSTTTVLFMRAASPVVASVRVGQSMIERQMLVTMSPLTFTGARM